MPPSANPAPASATGLAEAREQGWLGEVAAIETTVAAAAQKLEAMRGCTDRSTVIHLGMPNIRASAGRSSQNET